MKKISIVLMLLLSVNSFGQEADLNLKDTTKLVIGDKIYKIFHKKGSIDKIEVEDKEKKNDSLCKGSCKDTSRFCYKKKFQKYGHWGGVDFGVISLLNNMGGNTFKNQTFLENDPAKSKYLAINLLEHKFAIAGNYLGITTGLGFEWKNIAIKNNLQLNYNSDSLWATKDVVNNYDRNELRVSYFNIPLFLEFNSNPCPRKSWFLMAGVIGGLRMSSKLLQHVENKDMVLDKKLKGDYALNPFKLDASVRLGYRGVGVFANYNLIPMFDTKIVQKAFPLTFGLSWVW